MRLVFTVAAIVAALGQSARADTRLVFATDWRASGEQGGYYQALADGLYAARGLDVTIRQGGPAVNIPQLLGGGAIDLGMGSNSFIPLNMVRAGLKAKAVMASFQKDPQVLITHPRSDIRGIADMRGKPIMIADASIGAFWVWLRAKYGFEDRQIRKYSYSLAPFLVDPQAIQQGYVSSEPYLIERALGRKPQVFLLADEGYPGYASMVLATDRLIQQKPAVVQAFVDATIEGWRRYLSGDASSGNALIKKDNPEMTDELLAHMREALRAHHLVVPADPGIGGIGQMTEARWKAFFETMSAEDVYPADLPYRDAYTLRFIQPAQVTDKTP